MFKHARECGARTFDGVKVQSIQFEHTFCQDEKENGEQTQLGKPVSASWTCKDKTTGTIRFQYLVDASGRAGLISTKYMKNRKFNEGLKNVASWGYFEGFEMYGVGTVAEGCPYFPSFPGVSKIRRCHINRLTRKTNHKDRWIRMGMVHPAGGE